MRILCAALSGPGHGLPTLSLASRLVARGHEVTFLTGSVHAEDAMRAGCHFREMPVVFGSTSDRLRPYEDSEALARACIPLLAEIGPDVVVADLLTFGPALAADSLGIPWASLLVHGLHSYSSALPPFGFGRPPRWPRDAVLRWFQRRDLRRARDAVNEVRQRMGMPPDERLDAQLSPQLVIVPTLPCLEIDRPDWPARAHVVGPCLWPTQGEPVVFPPGDEPLVLVAASTAHAAIPMLHASVEALRRVGARAVITSGASAFPARAPTNTTLVEFCSHDEVLPHCAAVICNGGHGIVARALTHGVPLVVVPGHGDQRENGFRVERAGAGVSVSRPSPGELARALRRVLADDSYKRAATRAAEEAARLDGPGTAARLVEQLATGRLTPGATVTDG